MKLKNINLFFPSLIWGIWIKMLKLTEIAETDEERFELTNYPKVALSEKANPTQQWYMLKFTGMGFIVLLWIPALIPIPIVWLLLGQKFAILTFATSFIFVLFVALWLDIRILPAYFISRRWEKGDEEVKVNLKYVLYNADYVFSIALGLMLSISFFVVMAPHAY